MIRTGLTLASVAACCAVGGAKAEEVRGLDAHVHGTGTLAIAADGNALVMEFRAPGADIVGFETAPHTDAQHGAVEAALAQLSRPLEVFTLPDAAGCTVGAATAELVLEGDEHGHGDDHDDHGHGDDHDEHGHDDDHDEHRHDADHDEHGHDDDHDDHAGGHSEFHADIALTCDMPENLDSIAFAYFDAFPNALEVEVQIVTANGAQAFDVTRDAPELAVPGLFRP